MELILNRPILALHEFASKDETRLGMSGIQFLGDRATATNGHVLASCKLPHGQAIQNQLILRFTRKPVIPRRAKEIAITIDAVEGVFYAKRGGSCYGEVLREEFPDWDQVLPKEENLQQLGLNISYMRSVQQLFSRCPATKFEITVKDGELDRLGPLRISSADKGNGDFAILMPRRLT